MVESQNELSKLVDQLNRSATAAKSTEKRSLDQLLAVAFQRGASGHHPRRRLARHPAR